MSSRSFVHRRLHTAKFLFDQILRIYIIPLLAALITSLRGFCHSPADVVISNGGLAFPPIIPCLTSVVDNPYSLILCVPSIFFSSSRCQLFHSVFPEHFFVFFHFHEIHHIQLLAISISNTFNRFYAFRF